MKESKDLYFRGEERLEFCEKTPPNIICSKYNDTTRSQFLKVIQYFIFKSKIEQILKLIKWTKVEASQNKNQRERERERVSESVCMCVCVCVCVCVYVCVWNLFTIVQE